MISRFSFLAALLFPLSAAAGDLMLVSAWVPVAPPGAMSHAAYVTLHNHGDTPRILIGASAEGYAMTHLHESKETDGVATMSMIHQIEIPAGGMLKMAPGGLHVMLMKPEAVTADGSIVDLIFTFANGDTMKIEAEVKPRDLAS